MGIPAKVRERMVAGLKRLVPIIEQQRTRDASEADTVTLVKDLLSEVDERRRDPRAPAAGGRAARGVQGGGVLRHAHGARAPEVAGVISVAKDLAASRRSSTEAA
jgi:hypothetical protein